MDTSLNIQNTYSRPASNSFGHFGSLKLETAAPVKAVENFSSPTMEVTDPSKHGAIAQLINNHYFKQVKKETKRVLIGRKLEGFLKRTFNVRAYKSLPKAAQNLLKFDRLLRSYEIVKFTEYEDKSHDIVFKDYSMDQARFKVLFEALGELYDVQMKVGQNSYVSLSKDFETRKKVEHIFTKISEKLLFVKSKKKAKKYVVKKKQKEVDTDDEIASKYTKIDEDGTRDS